MNKEYQHTIKKSITVSGVGLHTGTQVDMTFHPAPANHGYKFRRTDLDGQPVIEADADLVTDTARGTTIPKNIASVSTIEHTLAALVGLGIDNVMIDLNGPETPIMDGSSKEFIQALSSVGMETQDVEREYITISENITFKDALRKTEITVMPADDYQVTVMIDFDSKSGLTSCEVFYAFAVDQEQKNRKLSIMANTLDPDCTNQQENIKPSYGTHKCIFNCHHISMNN